MAQAPVEKPPSRLAVAGTVTFYIVAAISMIVANKWVLNTTATPLFFLFAQLVIAVLLLLITDFLGIFKLTSKLDLAICKGLIPMVALNVTNLSCNNFTLKYVDASFYQVARGLVLPFTVALSSFMLHARPSSQILLSCLVVTAGFFVGVFLDRPSSTTGSSPLGITFGLISSATTACHAVVIKRSLPVVQGSAIQLAWYSNFLSAIVLIPLIIIGGETHGVKELFGVVFGFPSSVDAGSLRTFLWGTLITGLFGFLICVAGFLSIKVTSPITHMISSAVRGVFQTLVSIWLLGDIITTGRWSSIGIILIGSIYYTWEKHIETLEKQYQQDSRGAYSRAPQDESMESGLLAGMEGDDDRGSRGDRESDDVMMQTLQAPRRTTGAAANTSSTTHGHPAASFSISSTASSKSEADEKRLA